MTAIEVPHRIDGRDDAPALILSNSLGSTMAMWDPQVGPLAEHFRVVRYEHRGHGDAPVPPGPYELDELGGDLVALMDRLGIERAHVAGLSLGGMVGMWMGINAPERVDRLVLLCTSAMLSKDHDWGERARLVREGGTEAIADAVGARWFTPEFVEREPELTTRMKQMIIDTPDEGYAGCCGAIEQMDLIPELQRIQAPTLVIAGAEDPATPPRHSERMAELIPDARLEVVEHAAHLATVEQPEVVTALMRDHLLAGRVGAPAR
ncbi:MAG: 3-oxoadipate enol-lactonase [Solirubrobacteraceae bacterium]|jgi:3-oxoadipate enol-lactonase|nr:3-oxoadipate enol-lactonase [Solirubrobacteraceae bacterium]